MLAETSLSAGISNSSIDKSTYKNIKSKTQVQPKQKMNKKIIFLVIYGTLVTLISGVLFYKYLASNTDVRIRNVESKKELKNQELIKSDFEKVYICNGPNSAVYHKSKNCNGLFRCSKEITFVVKEKAIQIGRRPCKLEF